MQVYGCFGLTFYIFSFFWNSGRSKLIKLHAGVIGNIFCCMTGVTKQPALFCLWNTYRGNSKEQITRHKKNLIWLGIKLSTENFWPKNDFLICSSKLQSQYKALAGKLLWVKNKSGLKQALETKVSGLKKARQ